MTDFLRPLPRSASIRSAAIAGLCLLILCTGGGCGGCARTSYPTLPSMQHSQVSSPGTSAGVPTTGQTGTPLPVGGDAFHASPPPTSGVHEASPGQQESNPFTHPEGASSASGSSPHESEGTTPATPPPAGVVPRAIMTSFPPGRIPLPADAPPGIRYGGHVPAGATRGAEPRR